MSALPVGGHLFLTYLTPAFLWGQEWGSHFLASVSALGAHTSMGWIFCVSLVVLIILRGPVGLHPFFVEVMLHFYHLRAYGNSLLNR